MTHTLQIDISDSLYDTFIAFIQNLPQDIISVKKISTTDEISEDIIISSKNNLNEEINKRISEIQNDKIETNSLNKLSSLRERYVQN